MRNDSSRRQHSALAVSSLAFGAFASVTTEFIPVGVLPEVAQSFSVSPGQAGLMMTLPGVLGSLAAPGVLMAAGRLDRKWLLVTLSALLLVSATTSAIAHSWTLMLVSRALAGVSLGAFWAMGLAVAGGLVASEKAGSAIAAVFGGVTLAMILGVPLGAMVAEHSSWRGAFIAAASLAALAFILQLIFLPRITAGESMRPSHLARFFKRSTGRKSLLLIALIYGTHFGTYTYVAPLLKNAQVSPSAISWALLGFGLSGFVANFVASHYVGRLRITLSVALCAFIAALFLLTQLHATLPLVFAVIIWGAAWGAAPLCLNIGNRNASGEDIEAGSAMFTFTAQVSIALGSAMGGFIVDQLGLEADFLSGASLIVLSLVVLWFWRVDTAVKKQDERALCRDVQD